MHWAFLVRSGEHGLRSRVGAEDSEKNEHEARTAQSRRGPVGMRPLPAVWLQGRKEGSMKHSTKMQTNKSGPKTMGSEVANGRSLQFWIDNFLRRGQDLPPNSQLARRYDLHLLSEYASSRGILKAEQVSESNLKSFFATLLKNRSIGSVRRAYSTTRQFIAFLIDSKAIECARDPFRRVNLSLFQARAMRIPSVDPGSKNEDAYRTLVARARSLRDSESYGHKYRDYALVMILAHQGLFPSQLAQLRMDQLDLDFSSGKGSIHGLSEGRKHTVFDVVLSKEVVEALGLYFEKERGTGHGYLFPGRKNRPMTRFRILGILKEVSGSSAREIRRMMLRRLHDMKLSAIDIARKMNCNDLRCAQRY